MMLGRLGFMRFSCDAVAICKIPKDRLANSCACWMALKERTPGVLLGMRLRMIPGTRYVSVLGET